MTSTTTRTPSKSRGAMPRLAGVAGYWRDEPEALQLMFPRNRSVDIGWGEPFCFGCGWLAPVPDWDVTLDQVWNSAAGYLERGHLVDFARGGSNDCANLVPLCTHCHASMTRECSADTKRAAAAWITEHCRRPTFNSDEWWFWFLSSCLPRDNAQGVPR